MFSHKVFDLLGTFSHEEVKKFEDFLKSPYFSRKHNTFVLFKEIIRYYPTFTDKALSRKVLYEKIFASEKYIDSSLRTLFANLLNLAQDFLVIESFRKDKLNANNLLLEELSLRNQNDLFMRNLKKINESLKNFKEVDFNYVFSRYKLERNKFNAGIMHDKIIRKSKIYPQIEKLSDFGIYLTIYYATEIIAEYFTLVLYSEKFNTRQVSGFIKEILEAFDIKRIDEYIKDKNECGFMLTLYLALFSAFSEFGNIKNYYNYRKLVEKYSEQLSRDELSFHYSALISYCILKEKSGGYKDSLNEELLGLYVVVMGKEYYKDKKTNFLPALLFRDILFLQIRLRRTELVKILLTEYSTKLSPAERQRMLNFGYAFYYNALGEYERSLSYINRMKLDYFIFKYDIKNLTIRVFYNMEYFEEALSLIHSYREFLRKDEFLSERRKQRHKNFVKFAEHLILYSTGTMKNDPELIKKDIIRTEEISYKKWLLEKAEELIKIQKN